jgi:hypothetical protein
MSRRSIFHALLLGLCVELGMPAHTSLAGTTPSEVPESCPVTARLQPGFVPPHPYPAVAPYGTVWIGSHKLWVMASADGVWEGIGRDTPEGPVYRNKQFWWRPGYHGPSEPVPPLQVTGRPLDTDAAPIVVGRATNAHHPDFGGWTMLVMPEIPRGCWELTGRYGSERVTLVVWVSPTDAATRFDRR